MLVDGAEDQLRLRQNLRTAVQPSVRADDNGAARRYVGVSSAHNSTKASRLRPSHNTLVYDIQHDQ